MKHQRWVRLQYLQGIHSFFSFVPDDYRQRLPSALSSVSSGRSLFSALAVSSVSDIGPSLSYSPD